MRSPTRLTATLTLIAVLLGAITACGNDDETSDPATTPTTDPAAPEPTIIEPDGDWIETTANGVTLRIATDTATEGDIIAAEIECPERSWSAQIDMESVVRTVDPQPTSDDETEVFLGPGVTVAVWSSLTAGEFGPEPIPYAIPFPDVADDSIGDVILRGTCFRRGTHESTSTSLTMTTAANNGAESEGVRILINDDRTYASGDILLATINCNYGVQSLGLRSPSGSYASGASVFHAEGQGFTTVHLAIPLPVDIPPGDYEYNATCRPQNDVPDPRDTTVEGTIRIE